MMDRGSTKHAKPGLWILLLATLPLGACGTTPVNDPPSTFKTLNDQDYNFQTVWEVSLEAFRVMDFRVMERIRDSKGRVATIISELKYDKPVMFEGEQTAQRLRVDIAPSSATAHSIKVAAGRWKRAVNPREGPGLWVFAGPATGLHEEFEAALEQQFAARYNDGR